MIGYNGVPNKKRRGYIDENGVATPLGLRSGASQYFISPGSGTLDAGGTTIVTGTQFKSDSVVTASYRKNAAVTNTLAVELTDGTLTIKGDASEAFYYVAINVSFN